MLEKWHWGEGKKKTNETSLCSQEVYILVKEVNAMSTVPEKCMTVYRRVKNLWCLLHLLKEFRDGKTKVIWSIEKGFMNLIGFQEDPERKTVCKIESRPLVCSHFNSAINISCICFITHLPITHSYNHPSFHLILKIHV